MLGDLTRDGRDRDEEGRVLKDVSLKKPQNFSAP